jgi:hypothetical protein
MRIDLQRGFDLREGFFPAMGFGQLLGSLDPLFRLKPFVHRKPSKSPAEENLRPLFILSPLSDRGNCESRLNSLPQRVP